MHRRVYDSLKVKPKLQHKRHFLHIKDINMIRLIFVVTDMNRKLILGRDWLQKNGVRLYDDLGALWSIKQMFLCRKIFIFLRG